MHCLPLPQERAFTFPAFFGNSRFGDVYRRPITPNRRSTTVSRRFADVFRHSTSPNRRSIEPFSHPIPPNRRPSASSTLPRLPQPAILGGIKYLGLTPSLNMKKVITGFASGVSAFVKKIPSFLQTHGSIIQTICGVVGVVIAGLMVWSLLISRNQFEASIDPRLDVICELSRHAQWNIHNLENKLQTNYASGVVLTNVIDFEKLDTNELKITKETARFTKNLLS